MDAVKEFPTMILWEPTPILDSYPVFDGHDQEAVILQCGMGELQQIQACMSRSTLIEEE